MSDVEPVASYGMLRDAEPRIRETAESHGISQIRIIEDGLVVVDFAKPNPSYFDLLRFEQQIAEFLHSRVEVMTRDTFERSRVLKNHEDVGA